MDLSSPAEGCRRNVKTDGFNLSELFVGNDLKNGVTKNVATTLQAIVKTWHDQCVELTKAINDACPTGWLPDKLLDNGEDAKNMRELLFQNKSYPPIGGMLAALRNQIDKITILRQNEIMQQ